MERTRSSPGSRREGKSEGEREGGAKEEGAEPGEAEGRDSPTLREGVTAARERTRPGLSVTVTSITEQPFLLSLEEVQDSLREPTR